MRFRPAPGVLCSLGIVDEDFRIDEGFNCSTLILYLMHALSTSFSHGLVFWQDGVGRDAGSPPAPAIMSLADSVARARLMSLTFH